MPYKPKEIERILLGKLGFEHATTRSPDHRQYKLTLPGVGTIVTKLSHNNRDIGPSLERLIANQLRIKKQVFHGVMDCTKSREDYTRQVQDDPTPPIHGSP